jgi:(2S)-methylsuccinyl-CoA dehydrogenase
MREQDGAATVGDAGLDETLEAIRTEMRRFCEAEVLPHAHEWHLQNAYIPMEIIEELAEMGVFRPDHSRGIWRLRPVQRPRWCVVSEELSRGYIGVGSLGTRSEIAAELIICGGTDDQKAEIGCRSWPVPRSCPPPCSPSPTPGPILAQLSARAR